jgi:hypothetical protein
MSDSAGCTIVTIGLPELDQFSPILIYLYAASRPSLCLRDPWRSQKQILIEYGLRFQSERKGESRHFRCG